MYKWHVSAELDGRVPVDMMQEIAAGLASAQFLASGRIELRFEVEAANLAAALREATHHLEKRKGLYDLIAKGEVTGPHRIVVEDEPTRMGSLDLAGVAEGAGILGVSPARFRWLKAHDPDFPPAVALASGEIWVGSKLREYNNTRSRGKPGRPAKSR